jgi:hypothetical protein
LSDNVNPEAAERLVQDVSAWYSEQIIKERWAPVPDTGRLELLKAGLAAPKIKKSTFPEANTVKGSALQGKAKAKVEAILTDEDGMGPPNQLIHFYVADLTALPHQLGGSASDLPTPRQAGRRAPSVLTDGRSPFGRSRMCTRPGRFGRPGRVVSACAGRRRRWRRPGERCTGCR